MECHSPKCIGTMKIIVGILILLNAFVWPRWLGIDGWISFFAVLVILCGIIKFFHPSCGPSTCCPPTPKKAVRKKRRR
jgi:uncharacterized membrane protein HdeD (DUF308 family)